jgi:hypothetical protein
MFSIMKGMAARLSGGAQKQPAREPSLERPVVKVGGARTINRLKANPKELPIDTGGRSVCECGDPRQGNPLGIYVPGFELGFVEGAARTSTSRSSSGALASARRCHPDSPKATKPSRTSPRS